MCFRLIVLFFVCFLSGCSVFPFDIPRNYSLNESSGKGLVVFSVSEGCPSKMSMTISKAGKSFFGDQFAIDQSGAARSVPLQWQNPCGRTLFREYKQGDYEISSFVILGPVPGVTYAKPKDLPLIRFSIVPGRITYIGHLHFEFNYSIGQYNLSVEDQWARDAENLKNHAPNVVINNVNFAVNKETESYRGELLGVEVR